MEPSQEIPPVYQFNLEDWNLESKPKQEVNYIGALPHRLLCKILSCDYDDVKGKMTKALVSKKFKLATMDKLSWVNDHKLSFVTTARMAYVNGKSFKRSELDAAIFIYINLCKIRTLICNFTKASGHLIRSFCHPLLRKNLYLEFDEVSIQFEAHNDISGLHIIIDTLLNSASPSMVTQLNLSIRTKINELLPENAPVVRKLLSKKFWPYIMNCTSIKQLNVRCESPLVVSLKKVPRVITALPGLEELYINIQDDTDDSECDSIIQAINLVDLKTLRLRLKINDLDEFIHQHAEFRRISVTTLKLTPYDSKEEFWSQTMVQRLLNMYRSLTSLDINRWHTHHHWNIEIIANVVRSSLLQLVHRTDPQLSIKMRNHIGADVTLRKLKKCLTGIEVSYAGNFKFSCMFGRALVKLDLY